MIVKVLLLLCFLNKLILSTAIDTSITPTDDPTIFPSAMNAQRSSFISRSGRSHAPPLGFPLFSPRLHPRRSCPPPALRQRPSAPPFPQAPRPLLAAELPSPPQEGGLGRSRRSRPLPLQGQPPPRPAPTRLGLRATMTAVKEMTTAVKMEAAPAITTLGLATMVMKVLS